MTKLTDPTIAVIRNESNQLIRDEVRTTKQRTKLEAAVRDAVVRLGCSIDDISEASGLTPAEIKRVIADIGTLDSDVAQLAGLR